MTIPGAMQGLQQLAAATGHSGLAAATRELVALRASQINGCSICIDLHSRGLPAAGESETRLNTVAAWRETPYFSTAERAALALTEAATRLADAPEAVPDEIWEEAARHYDEPQLAALVLSIASINAWNRINATTRQLSGEWVAQLVSPELAAEAA
jgi:AhpD family alkylhydroperoxidase